MASGAGPTVSTPLTTGTITTTASDTTVTTNTCSTNAPGGVLVKLKIHWTPSATQTLTCKLYQVSTAGTQVGPAGGLVATGTGTTGASASFEFVDTSAYAQNTTGAVWAASLALNTGTGTITYAFTEVETLVPIA
jgi:hypothetical protein